MIIILCFDYGDRLSVVEVKHIVGKLRLTTSNDIATNVDPTIRDLGLHRNVTLPSIKNDRSNIIQNAYRLNSASHNILKKSVLLDS